MRKRTRTIVAVLLFPMTLGLTLYPPISNYVNLKYASEIQTVYQVTTPCKMSLGEWLDIMTVDNSSANAEAPLTGQHPWLRPAITEP